MLSRTERIAAALFEAVAMALMMALVAAVGWSVLGRQVLGIAVPWATEVAAGLCLWMICTGSVAAWARREHIVIDVMLRRMSGTPHRALSIVIELGSMLFLTVMFDGARRMMVTSANSSTTALSISYTWLYLALAVAAAGMFAFSVAHLVRLVIGKD